ncbi:MAG: SUMF1/EgtB/PvdO family nonheme iron enzyme [Phycisphaerales bacterium]
MRTNPILSRFAPALALALAAGAAHAQVVMETVRIGKPGNLGELSGETVAVGTFGNETGFGQTRVCGAVAYVYEIGKYEVTAAQYVVFLNAVAATDTYGLYNTFAHPPGEPLTTNIIRTGAPGSYTYSVPPDWAQRPVGGLSWADACRFANWMHNNQPTGPQGPATTETGAYALNGANTNPTLQGITRTPGARWALPTEDEWYKAAYHKNSAAPGSYWDFPTRADLSGFDEGRPQNDVLNPDPGNSANFWQSTTVTLDDDCIGPPYFRTVVGEFENSPSEYGTFDQGGNIWEWTEGRASAAGTPTSKRVMRGGSFYNLFNSFLQLNAAWRASEFTAGQLDRYGLRLVKLSANDCNGNGQDDSADIAQGASRDYNFNEVPDECDIALGTSMDCNGNGIPDDAETVGLSVPPYTWDDGVLEDWAGLNGGGSMVWLSSFEVAPGRPIITAVQLSFGAIENGQPVDIALWSDPDGDGNPVDAVLLRSASTTVTNFASNVLKTVPITPINLGAIGTRFFVGARVQHLPERFPANLDYSTNNSTSPGRSFLVASQGDPVDLANLGAAPFSGDLPSFGFSANWVLRAVAQSIVPLNDANGDGQPDDCATAGCPADFNGDGIAEPGDLDEFITAYFSDDELERSRCDFNNDGFIEPGDLDEFITIFFTGC